MNRDFFIRLAFATHRVADALEQGDQSLHHSGAGQVAKEMKESANQILVDFLLFIDKEVTIPEKKQNILFQLERQVDILLVYLDKAKKESWIPPENFALLEAEYGKLREFLELFEGMQGLSSKYQEEDTREEGKTQREEPKIERKEEKQVTEVRPTVPAKPEKTETGFSSLTLRQRKIIEFLRAKENAQVWELQKILPEVTKRTLRRDLDELLQKNLVERKGAWNAVAYQLK